MGYIHDRLKEALGGSRSMYSNSVVIKDWTPNNIKTLVIGKSFILVVYHVGGFGGSKVIPLDVDKVAEDIQYGGNSKLNYILKRRSLSCLEELYVDYAYIQGNPLIDLVGYVTELVDTRSRLRYFGYGDFPLGVEGWIKSAYDRNKGNLDYSIALDIRKPFRLEHKDVGYSEWYKSYYLRPQYYKLDEENGKLALHFRKFENDYRSYIAKKSEIDKVRVLEGSIEELVNNDCANISYLKRFDSLLLHLSRGSEDTVKSIVLKVCRNVIKSRESFPGMSREVLTPLLKNVSDRGYLAKSYERFGVLDLSGNDIDESKVSDYIENNKGLIDLGSILDKICFDSMVELSRKGYKDLLSIALLINEKDIPSGNFRNNFIKKSSTRTELDGYFGFLGEVIGVSL